MRVLLDTNIFIYREDDKILSNNLQSLLKTMSKMKTEILIHPLSINELKRDKNVERKKIIISKVNSYCQLESFPEPQRDTEFKERINWKNDKKNIEDNTILYAVYKDAVDFLITEDKEIHKKANNLKINDRILFVDGAIKIFKKGVQSSKIITPPALRKDFVFNLNIDDPIFNQLKKDYPKFDDWFKRISREGRECWVYYRGDNSIGALLIFKIEDESIDSEPPLPKKNRLKLSTFIVSDIGYKIGELFIKISVDFSVKNDIFEIYLTYFTKPNDDHFVQLITEYGFHIAAVNKNGEDIFIKNLIMPKEFEYKYPIEVTKRYYPSFYDGLNVNKFVMPIQPKYHDRLFTDFLGRQTTIIEHLDSFIVEGNTIKKAYLTHSRIKKMETGDVILFYRSQDQSKITSLGIIESVHTMIQNSDEIIKLVGKRTVYTIEEIEEFVNKPTTVILFSHHFHLKIPLHLDELKNIGALSGAPQTIVEINNISYNKIKTRGGIDECFTVN